MFILDKYVASEPTRHAASAHVQAWFDEHAPETLYLTSISLAELLLGIETLPLGRRKAGLAGVLSELLGHLFDTRILTFDADADAVQRSASMLAKARKRGCSISMAAGTIASIAATHGVMVATRNTAPFELLGVPVINSWKA